MAINVCIIGAGPSGIIMMKYLAEYPEQFNITCYEQTPHIGGAWVYTDRVGTDEEGIPIHTSMYKYLTSNFPKHLMELEGFPFSKELPSFIEREDFLKYLHDYCDAFNLIQYIQLKTKVDHVTPLENILHNNKKWKVRTKTFGDDVTKESVFNAVVVCNGHFSVPYIPNIPGLETFHGQWLHSRDYRIPEIYTGKTVMCVGGLLSAQEIALQLITYAKKIYMSHGKTIIQFPDEVYQVPIITCIEGNKVILNDQSEICDIDCLIFCTGYQYTFDFLDKSCHPHIDSNKKITPLYQHIVHVEYPTLFFLGLTCYNAVIKTTLIQAKFVQSALLGKMKLPTKEEMYKHIEDFFAREAAFPNPNYCGTCILHTQWDYHAEMAKLGKFQNLPPVIEKLFKSVRKLITDDITKLRNYEYCIIDDENFEVTYKE